MEVVNEINENESNHQVEETPVVTMVEEAQVVPEARSQGRGQNSQFSREPIYEKLHLLWDVVDAPLAQGEESPNFEIMSRTSSPTPRAVLGCERNPCEAFRASVEQGREEDDEMEHGLTTLVGGEESPDETPVLRVRKGSLEDDPFARGRRLLNDAINRGVELQQWLIEKMSDEDVFPTGMREVDEAMKALALDLDVEEVYSLELIRREHDAALARGGDPGYSPDQAPPATPSAEMVRFVDREMKDLLVRGFQFHNPAAYGTRRVRVPSLGNPHSADGPDVTEEPEPEFARYMRKQIRQVIEKGRGLRAQEAQLAATQHERPRGSRRRVRRVTEVLEEDDSQETPVKGKSKKAETKGEGKEDFVRSGGEP